MTWRGEETLALNDDLNSTCLTFNTTSLRRETDHIIITNSYSVSVDVWLSGWGLVCAPDICTERFPTQVFQQGRHPGFCVQEAPLCLGATLCPLVSHTTYSSDDYATCQFRCHCPVAPSAVQTLCEKMVVMFGYDSVGLGRMTMELCDVSVAGT